MADPHMPMDDAARRIAAARLQRGLVTALPAASMPMDEAEGYRLQSAVHRLLSARLGPIAGHKIGCTTAVMQRMLGIASPCAGAIFASTAFRGSAALPHLSFWRVGVECEIAVFLGEDVGPSGAPWSAERIGSHVAGCAVAMEIVDDRYDDYRRLGAPLLIADDFFNAGCIVGAPVSDWRRLNLTALGGRTTINGVEVGNGFGRDVMGHPFAAVAWLANLRAAQGTGLRAGEFVLTGSVVETRWVARGDQVSVVVDELGEVTASFD